MKFSVYFAMQNKRKYIDDISKLTNLKYLEIVYDSNKNKLDFLPIIKEYVTLIIRTLENASILTINKNIAHIYSNLHLCCKLQFIKELYIHNDGIVELVINYKSRKNMPNIIFNRVYLIMDNYRIPMNAIFYAIAELDDTRSNIKTQKLVVEGLNDENIEKLSSSLAMFSFKFSYIKFKVPLSPIYATEISQRLCNVKKLYVRGNLNERIENKKVISV